MQEQKASIKFIEKLYKLYEQKMYQAAYHILHDSWLAEDAVQEAFLKLMKCNIYFEDAESDDCKRYLITVIKHSSIDIYNKKRKEQELLFLTGEEVDGKGDTVSGDVDVEELISGLPPKYYAVVNCLAVKSLSVKETAAELGITDVAVRKRFERAKVMLKTIQKGSEGHATERDVYRSNIFRYFG